MLRVPHLFLSSTVLRSASHFSRPTGSLLLRAYSTIPDSSPVRAYAKGDLKVRFSQDHEWLALHEDSTAFLGITKYAADTLGDIVFVELPEVGTTVEIGDSIGAVESVKSASDIYSPVSGEIVAVNEELNTAPGLMNKEPYGEGWLVRIQLTNPDEADGLLDDIAYDKFVTESSDQ